MTCGNPTCRLAHHDCAKDPESLHGVCCILLRGLSAPLAAFLRGTSYLLGHLSSAQRSAENVHQSQCAGLLWLMTGSTLQWIQVSYSIVLRVLSCLRMDSHPRVHPSFLGGWYVFWSWKILSCSSSSSTIVGCTKRCLLSRSSSMNFSERSRWSFRLVINTFVGTSLHRGRVSVLIFVIHFSDENTRWKTLQPTISEILQP